jgi:hypothetical protein
MAQKRPPIHLYWVEDPYEDENWFIFAYNEREARCFHRDYEGFDTIRGISAEPVVNNIRLAKLTNGEPPCHAQLPDLRKLGFEIVGPDPNQRVVRLNGETFVEGCLESLVTEARDNLSESLGHGRPNRTRKPTLPN